MGHIVAALMDEATSSQSKREKRARSDGRETVVIMMPKMNFGIELKMLVLASNRSRILQNMSAKFRTGRGVEDRALSKLQNDAIHICAVQQRDSKIVVFECK